MNHLSKIAQRHKRFEMLLALRKDELGGELHRSATENQPNTGGSLNVGPHRYLKMTKLNERRT